MFSSKLIIQFRNIKLVNIYKKNTKYNLFVLITNYLIHLNTIQNQYSKSN